MTNLIDYINESLLDDFDEIAKDQHNELEHPWGSFWKNVHKTKRWNNEIKTLEQTISIDAKKITTVPKLVDKGVVYVGFWKPIWGANDTIYIVIRYNKDDFKVMDKYFKSKPGRKPIGANRPVISITPLSEYNKIPHISTGLSAQLPSDYRTDMNGYLLSIEQSQKAIDMIDKFANHEWDYYWKKL